MSSGAGTLLGPPEAGAPEPPSPRPKRRAQLLPWFGVLALTFSAVVGSNMLGLRDHFFEPAAPEAAPPAAGRSAGAISAQDTVVAAPTSLRSQPWWQDVTVLNGTGTTTSQAFTIVPGAIQWRVKWTCQAGHLTVRSPHQTRPVVDGNCPEGAVGYGTRSGPISLQVTATGPWQLEVAQQIDSALVEPPLPAMTAPGAAAIGTGTFYNIDKVGTGKVTMYRQADGKYSVRLEDFFVSPTADLELRLSTLDAPRSSPEFLNAESELVVPMDITAGSLNYTVPSGVDPTKFRSVVIWCAPINSAYAAASLGPVR
ncbi:MAG: DM13 domain-containing protein [Acidimicrobiales bacterium]